jgi:hypothetical protein
MDSAARHCRQEAAPDLIRGRDAGRPSAGGLGGASTGEKNGPAFQAGPRLWGVGKPPSCASGLLRLGGPALAEHDVDERRAAEVHASSRAPLQVARVVDKRSPCRRRLPATCRSARHIFSAFGFRLSAGLSGMSAPRREVGARASMSPIMAYVPNADSIGQGRM